MSKSYKHMQLLLYAIEGINRTMELKSLLLKSMNSSSLLMNTEASSLILIDKITGDLHVSIPTGPVKDQIKGKSIPKGSGIAGWVIKNKKTYLSNDLSESEVFWGDLSTDFKTKNILCSPLINSKNEVIGVIQVLNKKDGSDFSEDEAALFESLAGHIALSIEKADEVETLKKEISDREKKLKDIHQGLNNNLSAVNALIQLEMPSVMDETAQFVLKATGSRIEAISNAHHILYSDKESDDIDIGLYLGRLTTLVSEIFETEDKEIGFLMDIDRVLLKADTALTIGLIVIEVLIQMYRYAFVDATYGQIRIGVKKNDSNLIVISISDDGKGIDEILDEPSEESISSIIIDTLISRLNASISQSRSDKGSAKITIIYTQ